MTTPRSQAVDSGFEEETAKRGPSDETPQLNVYTIHSERTIVTEPGNTDGWIATDTTVEPWA